MQIFLIYLICFGSSVLHLEFELLHRLMEKLRVYKRVSWEIVCVSRYVFIS